MKVSARWFTAALLPLLLFAAASSARAQVYRYPFTAPPTALQTIDDITVPAGTTVSKINLKKIFALNGVNGQTVRFATNLGNIDVELLAADAPATVANFLSYVNRPDTDSRLNYTNSIIHRSVPGFIIQGGAYQLNGRTDTSPLSPIVPDPKVVNEFKVSNIRGTLAMAKKDGKPNSAKQQWFFNEADANAQNLDMQNSGFTVFGRIVGQKGLDVMDAIGAVPVYDAGAPLDNLPLIDYQNGDDVVDDVVIVKSVRPIAMTPTVTGEPALLKIKVTENTNPDLVKTSFVGSKLKLNYAPGQTGTARITVTAQDTSKNKAPLSFNVTVR